MKRPFWSNRPKIVITQPLQAKNVPNGRDHSTLSLHPDDMEDRVQSRLSHSRPALLPHLSILRPRSAVGKRMGGARLEPLSLAWLQGRSSVSSPGVIGHAGGGRS